MTPGLESLDIETTKPIVEDIFNSISPKFEGLEKEEPTILTPSIQENPEPQTSKKKEFKTEAYAVVESFPDLSFLSARKLMHTANENMNRWRVRP